MIRDSEHGSGRVRTGGVSRVIRDSEHGSGQVRTGGISRVIRDSEPPVWTGQDGSGWVASQG